MVTRVRQAAWAPKYYFFIHISRPTVKSSVIHSSSPEVKIQNPEPETFLETLRRVPGPGPARTLAPVKESSERTVLLDYLSI